MPSARALLHGVRLWVSVCVALYIAYALQLADPFWAGTSAAVVCQPHVGGSLRKGWFRMLGTLVGAVFVVLLAAGFAQQRAVFLVALALWVGASAWMASVLRNFMSYAAALAGFTAVIIAGDLLGDVGGASDQVFLYVYTRTSEICIGIVTTSVVLAATDFGGAQQRLAGQFAGLTTEITRQFGRMLSQGGAEPLESLKRSEVVRRAVALEPLIDEAIGESARLRALSPTLHAAVQHVFGALAGWRTVAAHLVERPDTAGDDERVMLRRLQPEMQMESRAPLPATAEDFVGLREGYRERARRLMGLTAATPSVRLLSSYTARVFADVAGMLDGLVLLSEGPAPRVPRCDRLPWRVADWLPAFINGARASLAMCVVELLWVATAWPNGTTALVFAAVAVTRFAPRGELAFGTVTRFMGGVALSACCAAIAKFALLPGMSTFAAFSVVMGVFLIPLGALTNQQVPAFIAAASLFSSLLQPENRMSYDTLQFYNYALAILVGIAAAAFSYRLIPPLDRATRCRRLLALTLRDLRRIATGAAPWAVNEWKALMMGRLSSLPDDADPLRFEQLIAALSVGVEITRLRRDAHRLGCTSLLAEALRELALGRGAASIRCLMACDRALIPGSTDGPGRSEVMRARASILVVSEGLSQHPEYFDSGASR